jgi:glycosyltransferase involved in cell wall biosynthesis
MFLTVAILTKNESQNLPDCLQSVLGPGGLTERLPLEVLVVDDDSQDDTPRLAQDVGARVLTRRLDDFASQRNFALSQATGSWVFFLDADERVTPELSETMAAFLEEGRSAAGSVKRSNFAFGHHHRFGLLAPDRVVRLFPKEAVNWEGLVHERPVFNLPVKALAGALIHNTYRSWDQHQAKAAKYMALWVKQAARRGRRATVLQAVFRGAAGFFKMFFLKLGFLGGPVEWALCWLHGSYTLGKYLRLSELQQRPSNKT